MSQPDQAAAAAAPLTAVGGLYLGQVGAAAASLRKRVDSDAAVHDTRKTLKRARATLRLLRAALGDAAFRRENRLLRDAGRPLTAIRDARTLMETLELLRRKSDGEGTRASGRQLMRALRREHAERLEAFKTATMRAEAARLEESARRIHELTGKGARNFDVKQGLAHAYRKARAARATAESRPSDEDLHEWRKQVKYFLNELGAVAHLHGPRFARWRSRSERLAKHLGDDHDLAVLHQKMNQLATLPPFAGKARSLKKWTSRLAKRRRRLQRKALRLGEKLFAPKPKHARRYIAKRLGNTAEQARG